MFQEFSGRVCAQTLELADEMGLVGIAAMQGHIYPVRPACLHQSHCLLELDHPAILFRIHPHTITEHSFKLLPAQTRFLSKAFYGNRRIGEKSPERSSNPVRVQRVPHTGKKPLFK